MTILVKKSAPGKINFQISVKDFVEFCWRSGNLSRNAKQSSPSALEGQMAHKKVQNQWPDQYQKEINIEKEFSTKHYQLQLKGRIDGLLQERSSLSIFEIKTVLEHFHVHDQAEKQQHIHQAKVYAYLTLQKLPASHRPSNITISIIYYSILKTQKIAEHHQFSQIDIEDFFQAGMDRFINWLDQYHYHLVQRNTSAQNLKFPYPEFRSGQWHFSAHVYQAIKRKSSLLAQAPTGTGKTISTLFPSIKAYSDHADKLVYLTAKKSGRISAEKAAQKILSSGARIKCLTLSSLEDSCFCDQNHSDQSQCPYDKDFYNRLSKARQCLFEHDLFDLKTLRSIAQQHQLCPYYLAKNLLPWIDLLICDYNQVFSPSQNILNQLTRDALNTVLLVDECHNLIDRGRRLYSAALSRSELIGFLKLADEILSANGNYGITAKNKLLLKNFDQYAQFESAQKTIEQPPSDYFISQLDEIFRLVYRQSVAPQTSLFANTENVKHQQVIYSVANFILIAKLWGPNFKTIISPTVSDDVTSKQNFCVTLFCLDPSPQLRDKITLFTSKIFFSATLTPIELYPKQLGLPEESRIISIPSPFPTQNLNTVVISHLNTRYKYRQQSIDQIIEYIATTIQQNNGNYFVIFPSYNYLAIGAELFRRRFPDIEIYTQQNNMGNEEKNKFLATLEHKEKETSARAYFIVMGGSFAEGIDLPGDQLIGCIIVGVGLPKICLERNLIRDYFDQLKLNGFAFSYEIPGITRVLQAAGRLIRTEEDRGVLVLIDDRYKLDRYSKLLPNHWDRNFIESIDSLKSNLLEFWN